MPLDAPDKMIAVAGLIQKLEGRDVYDIINDTAADSVERFALEYDADELHDVQSIPEVEGMIAKMASFFVLLDDEYYLCQDEVYDAQWRAFAWPQRLHWTIKEVCSTFLKVRSARYE